MDPRSLVDWKEQLPRLRGRTVELREPAPHDVGPLTDLFSIADAPRFGLTAPIGEAALQQFIQRAIQERAAGTSFTYVVTLAAQRAVVGLIQVRNQDVSFETAEWEGLIVPSSRGTGVFVEAARLVGSFAFGSVGVHRLESRVLLQNGRANGALRKIGAVQEGVLRRSLRRGDEYLDQVLWAVLKDDWSDRTVPAAARVH
jgi:RimJ/RimL family protein N-acetyltransferase